MMGSSPAHTPMQFPESSPYFARPFVPSTAGHRAQLARARTSALGRPETARLAGAKQRQWLDTPLSLSSSAFDPHLGPFTMRRAEGAISVDLMTGHRRAFSAQSGAHTARSSTAHSSVTDSARANNRNRKGSKVCRPMLWGGGLGSVKPCFDALHPAEIDRHHGKFTLGPSLGGQRKMRIAPELLEAEPMNVPGGREARALSEILEVVQIEGGAFDAWWMHPSSRALSFVPRILSKLHRWEEFVQYVCNLDFVIEGILEHGLLEVEERLQTAFQRIVAQRSNTRTFVTKSQNRIDAHCQRKIGAYVEFIQHHRAALASAPRSAFRIAMAADSVVQEDVSTQIAELQALLNRCSAKLPTAETDAMVRIYRAIERAQSHGLDSCLSSSVHKHFLEIKDELTRVMDRMCQSSRRPQDLDACADQLLGQFIHDIHPLGHAKMTREGFNDLVMATSREEGNSSSHAAEATFVLKLRNPHRIAESDLLRTIAQCALLHQDQVQIVEWKGANIVLRIVNELQAGEREQSEKSSVLQIRDKILAMARDPASALRQSGLIYSVGGRSGRWESVTLGLCNTSDMEYESEYLQTFVLPALRAQCRRRKIDLTWFNLGSTLADAGKESYREALNRMDALKSCSIHPPGSHKRPFMLSLLGSLGDKSFGDIVRSHVNEHRLLRDPFLSPNLQWIDRDGYMKYGVTFLQVCDAFLRCSDATESFFIIRNSEWLLEQKVVQSVPAFIRDKFIEDTKDRRDMVSDFTSSVREKAGQQNRIIGYQPSFANLLGPKSKEDMAETQQGVFKTNFQRMRRTALVNKVFWQAMQNEGREVLNSCKTSDQRGAGVISKQTLRNVLDQHGMLSLLSDSEMTGLIAAYESEESGNVDYAALIQQFLVDGRMRMRGMAKLGLATYQFLLDTIDAYFPTTIEAGTRYDRDLNEQEAMLHAFSSSSCHGVNHHIFCQLKEFAHSNQTLDVVAVRGVSGCGKSTLLATLAQHCMLELGHHTDHIYYCLQPWHRQQDILSCLIAQLDRGIVEREQVHGKCLTARSLTTGLSRHAQTRTKDVLIIADGLLSSGIEDLVIFAVKQHNAWSAKSGYRHRVRLILGTIPAERHSPSDLLSLAILPLMPSERMNLIRAQDSRNHLNLSPDVSANLCRIAAGGSEAKFLVVASSFLSYFHGREHMRITSELSGCLQDLYATMIFPFLESQKHGVKRILELLYFEEESGIFRSEILRLTQSELKENEVFALCRSLRLLGIAATTADEDRIVISCREARAAIYERYICDRSVLKNKFDEFLCPEKLTRGSNGGQRKAPESSNAPYGAHRANIADVHTELKTDTEHQTPSTEHEQTVDDESRSLSLENHNLRQMPDEIFSKSSRPDQIRELILSSNCIEKVDQRIARLSNLRQVDLSVNRIVSLPEQIAFLSRLERLDVSDNQIEKISPAMWMLENLRVLQFSRNHVSHLGDGLGQLTSLQELVFSQNNLVTLPESVVRLSNLTVLDVSRNGLSEIPALSEFPHMRVLCLASNRFSSIPPLTANLLLEDIDLECNLLTCMPAMMSCHPKLSRINLANNKIQYLDAHISGCLSLENLNASENNLESIPEEFGALTHLKTLAISDNKLKFLPQGLFKLCNLTSLDVSGNLIKSMAPELSELTCLQTLYLSDNQFTVLPIQLCDMKHITCLDVANNPVEDPNDPVLALKREERAQKGQRQLVQRSSEGWEEHDLQMQAMKVLQAKRDEEHMTQRVLRSGVSTPLVH